jgi:two-component system heavy metal sensor histidine kinase CusS
MTRRIAITILLTVWAAILIAGAAAWGAAYISFLSKLDKDAINQVKGTVASLSKVPGRRVIVQNTSPDPEIISKSFVSRTDGRWRQLMYLAPGSEPGDYSFYYLNADDFWNTLTVLGIAILGCGTVAGAIAALLAARIARLALRPLNSTVEIIGSIDESKLDRRISAEELPVELRPMADRLNDMLERLGDAFEQRRRFLADASHELRTPVAAMITTMEVALRRPRPATELTEILDTCLSEARHMRQLVQALLRQVRAEGAGSSDEPQDVDAGEMLNQCAELAGSLAAEKHIKLVRHVNGKIPVHAELGRLRSVVLNLVSNAIEYNSPGGTVELSAESDGGGTEIVVKDNGPGIAPEHLPHLFQPFYRATRARESDGHLGLGLFLVDSHVKAMGGECHIESALGCGTTFRVRLPSTSLPSSGNGGL